ncbi:MAG TPA: RNA polymerase subunit sigma, partial [Armatimonadota bacterium]|nr:RNA polymerase subunit sigma [Armatimonadota bacterium]
LWFDACLYDQITLCRQLDWFAHQTRGATSLSLICIGAYPGMPVFHGLGELSNAQLAGLLPQRQAVTPAQTALGVAAWQAYRSADPTAIERLLAQDTSALPYLAPALVKHLERFPSVRNGVNRMEQEILELVANGYHRYEQIFHRLSDLEQPAYFGLEYLFHQLETLTAGPYPLLTMHGLEPCETRPRHAWPIDQSTYLLTSTGEAVMHGQADWITLNGLDRWLGGVHLHGAQSEWRWDGQQQLVRMI